jgi:hypothetical protein
MIANIQRQPNTNIRNVSIGAEIAVPRADALMKMPVASPRSLAWNRFAEAQRDARRDELPEIADQAAEQLRDRPEHQPQAQRQARLQPVDDPARGKLRERVGPQKRRQQQPHIGDRQPHLLPDQRVRDRQRRSVHVGDGAAEQQHGQRDPLGAPHARRRHRLGHSCFPRFLDCGQTVPRSAQRPA